MPDFDVAVIGSGLAGAHSAWPLVEAGLRVVMLDGGRTPDADSPLDAEVAGFAETRRTDAAQSRWFLGADLSAIPVRGMTAGPGGQLSGNRGFAVRDADRLLPLVSRGATVMQTLARGGFASVWGATCEFYDPAELAAAGLPVEELETSYGRVTERIGLSGPPGRPGVQPPLELDAHARAVLAAFERRRDRLAAERIEVAQPYSAVLTEARNGRQAADYRDMDYWSDAGRSIYRPQYTLAELEERDGFDYAGGRLVETVERAGGGLVVRGRLIESGDRFEVRATRVVMAAGAVGSARILLRSLGLFDRPVPLLAKSQVLLACVRPASLGDPGPDRRTSLCQLILHDRTPESGLESASAQLYSYRSLQLFRLLSGLPLPLPEALDVLRLLAPSMVVADVRFPTFGRPGRSLTLRSREGGDVVEVVSEPDAGEARAHREALKRVRRALRRLGVLPLRAVPMPAGSTIHYAGTIPNSGDGALPLSTDSDGRLRQLEGVWVADGSTFRCLPAKPPGLTFMANADRVARALVAS